MLRHDDCEDSVICDCSLPVGDHLDADDDAADLSVVPPCGTDEPQPSPLQPWGQPTFDHVNGEQHVSSSVSDRTQQKSSSAACREYNAASGRCRTFKLPDVQVRLTSPQRTGPSDRPSANTVSVVSSPDVINDPHYTVV